LFYQARHSNHDRPIIHDCGVPAQRWPPSEDQDCFLTFFGDAEPMKGERLHGLDALRGIAAFAVLLHHCDILLPVDLGFSRGYLAVDFFFMLSGFVMARTFETRFAEGLRPLPFVKSRITRFWAPMALGATIGLLVYVRANSLLSLLPYYVCALLFIPLPGIAPFILNGPAWSLFDEFVVNGLHAAWFYKLRVPALLAISVGALILMGVIGKRFGTAWFGLPRVMISYPLGMVLWRINGDKVRMPWWCAAVALIGGILLADLLSLGVWFDFCFVGLAAVGVIGGLGRPPFPVWVAATLGAVSFPLYAIHNPIVFGLRLAGFGLFPMLAGAGIGTLLLMWARKRCLPALRPITARQIHNGTRTSVISDPQPYVSGSAENCS
jgi:peptidoglycan/LPS O-acetylase OafA/YrhL